MILALLALPCRTWHLVEEIHVVRHPVLACSVGVYYRGP